MMRCDKTGISDKEWKTILDVLNVYDPNDIKHVYPEMGGREFVQGVASAFQKVRAHILRLNELDEAILESKVKPFRGNSDVAVAQEECDSVHESNLSN